MDLDQQVINKYFLLMIVVLFLVNTIFFLLNIVFYERIILNDFFSESLLVENQEIKLKLNTYEKMEVIYTGLISQQKLHIEYYNSLLQQSSLKHVKSLKDQEKFFNKKLENIKLENRKDKKCQKNLLMSGESKQNLGVGGF